MEKYHSDSENTTKAIAAKISGESKGNIFALTGELGAGKTIFAQGFAEGLGITEKIISPTFVLIRQHKIPNRKGIFFHIDLYRIENISGIGLEEILSDPNNIVLVEWAEKIENILPAETVKISVEKTSESERLITVE